MPKKPIESGVTTLPAESPNFDPKTRQDMDRLMETPWEKQNFSQFNKVRDALIVGGDVEMLWKINKYDRANKIYDTAVESGIVQHGKKEDRTRLMDETELGGYTRDSLQRVMHEILRSPHAEENVDDLMAGVYELLKAHREMERDPEQDKYKIPFRRTGGGGYDMRQTLEAGIVNFAEKISLLKGGEQLRDNAQIQEITEKVQRRREKEKQKKDDWDKQQEIRRQIRENE